MTIKQIHKLRNSEPFRPFYLQLADGRNILITDPEHLGYSMKGHTMSVFASHDAGELIDVRDISAIREYQPQRNGEKNR